MRIVRPFFTRVHSLLIPVVKSDIVLSFISTYGTDIVSGYSMSMTERRSDSFADRRPNCISLTVRVGALEYAKLRFDMIAVV